MRSEDVVIKVENEEETIKCEVEDGCNPEVKKPSDRVRVHGTRRSYNVRTQNRARLRRLLDKLMKNHSWKESCGVLSVLLEGTRKEECRVKNRDKYWAAMELLNKMDRVTPTKILPMYELWKRKNKWLLKDKFSVELEYILFCIAHGNIDTAHQSAQRLIQDMEYRTNPLLNLTVGMVFYERWYSGIPETMKLKSYDTYDTPNLSEISEMSSIPDAHCVESQVQCGSEYSNSSVGIEKRLPTCVDNDVRKKQNTSEVSQQRDFYIEDSAQSSENDEALISNCGHNLRSTSKFYSRGVNMTLLPIRLPESNENMDESFYLDEHKFNDDDYKNAVKHLRLALDSSPPVLVALYPLIQLLLLRNQVTLAMKELEKFCYSSNALLPLRLKASLLECFSIKDSMELSMCYEDILKKDPTCSHSLTRLITMYKNGEYGLEAVIEVIALHLDATFATSDIWGVFASCFLELAQCEEDRMSVCGNATMENNFESINTFTGAFITGRSRKSWRLRCKWWSTRHFSESARISESGAGDLQLLSSKAACALHLYGHTFDYVVSVYTYLEKEKSKDMILFLQTHIDNSCKLFEFSK